MLLQVKAGDTVRIHYTGKLADGTVFDSSREREPLELTTGQGSVIPGFERALLGMSPGDHKTETIPSHEAYGPYQENLVAVLDTTEFLDRGITPNVGMQLEVRQPDGQKIPVLVTEVSTSQVKLDANHPLAGQDLTFEIELLEIVGG